jgi:hypothetical protein
MLRFSLLLFVEQINQRTFIYLILVIQFEEDSKLSTLKNSSSVKSSSLADSRCIYLRLATLLLMKERSNLLLSQYLNQLSLLFKSRQQVLLLLC